MTILKINLWIAIICMSVIQTSYAQQDIRKFDSNLSLRIGDTFIGPKKVELMRGNIKTISWKAWNDRIIVLDFFDTYCSTCIQSMPHLQQLQKQFGDKIQIINVTWQDKKTLDKFFAGNKFLSEKNVNLPVIYNDKALRSMFPYQAAPHVAIIYKGKVKAITFPRLLTATNMETLLVGGNIQFPWKNDFGEGGLSQYNQQTGPGVLLKGYQDGIRGQALKFEKDSLTGMYKTSIYNRSIYTCLLSAWSTLEKPKALLRAEQVVWNVKDSSRFKNFTNTGEAWDVKHAISYERLDRVQRSDTSQAKILLNDLHSLLGVRSYRSTKVFQCLILKTCPVQKNDNKVQNEFGYESTDVFSKYMAFREEFPLILDQVKSSDTFYLGPFNNLKELNDQLRRYGYELVEGEGEFETFVIEEESGVNI